MNPWVREYCIVFLLFFVELAYSADLASSATDLKSDEGKRPVHVVAFIDKNISSTRGKKHRSKHNWKTRRKRYVTESKTLSAGALQLAIYSLRARKRYPVRRDADLWDVNGYTQAGDETSPDNLVRQDGNSNNNVFTSIKRRSIGDELGDSSYLDDTSYVDNNYPRPFATLAPPSYTDAFTPYINTKSEIPNSFPNSNMQIYTDNFGSPMMSLSSMGSDYRYSPDKRSIRGKAIKRGRKVVKRDNGNLSRSIIAFRRRLKERSAKRFHPILTHFFKRKSLNDPRLREFIFPKRKKKLFRINAYARSFNPFVPQEKGEYPFLELATPTATLNSISVEPLPVQFYQRDKSPGKTFDQPHAPSLKKVNLHANKIDKVPFTNVKHTFTMTSPDKNVHQSDIRYVSVTPHRKPISKGDAYYVSHSYDILDKFRKIGRTASNPLEQIPNAAVYTKKIIPNIIPYQEALKLESQKDILPNKRILVMNERKENRGGRRFTPVLASMVHIPPEIKSLQLDLEHYLARKYAGKPITLLPIKTSKGVITPETSNGVTTAETEQPGIERPQTKYKVNPSKESTTYFQEPEIGSGSKPKELHFNDNSISNGVKPETSKGMIIPETSNKVITPESVKLELQKPQTKDKVKLSRESTSFKEPSIGSASKPKELYFNDNGKLLHFKVSKPERYEQDEKDVESNQSKDDAKTLFFMDENKKLVKFKVPANEASDHHSSGNLLKIVKRETSSSDPVEEFESEVFEAENNTNLKNNGSVPFQQGNTLTGNALIGDSLVSNQPSSPLVGDVFNTVYPDYQRSLTSSNESQSEQEQNDKKSHVEDPKMDSQDETSQEQEVLQYFGYSKNKKPKNQSRNNKEARKVESNHKGSKNYETFSLNKTNSGHVDKNEVNNKHVTDNVVKNDHVAKTVVVNDHVTFPVVKNDHVDKTVVKDNKNIKASSEKAKKLLSKSPQISNKTREHYLMNKVKNVTDKMRLTTGSKHPNITRIGHNTRNISMDGDETSFSLTEKPMATKKDERDQKAALREYISQLTKIDDEHSSIKNQSKSEKEKDNDSSEGLQQIMSFDTTLDKLSSTVDNDEDLEDLNKGSYSVTYISKPKSLNPEQFGEKSKTRALKNSPSSNVKFHDIKTKKWSPRQQMHSNMTKLKIHILTRGGIENKIHERANNLNKTFMMSNAERKGIVARNEGVSHHRTNQTNPKLSKLKVHFLTKKNKTRGEKTKISLKSKSPLIISPKRNGILVWQEKSSLDNTPYDTSSIHEDETKPPIYEPDLTPLLNYHGNDTSSSLDHQHSGTSSLVDHLLNGTSYTLDHQLKDTKPSLDQQLNGTNPSLVQQLNGTNPSSYQQLKGTNPSLDQKLNGTNPSSYQQLKGTKPSLDQQLNGTNPSSDQQLKGTNPSLVQQLKGTNPSLDQQLNSTNPSLDQQLNGTNPSLDQQLKGTNPSLDQQLNGTNPSLDQQLNGTNPSLDPQLNGTNPSLDPQLNGTNSSLDNQLNGTNTSLDHQTYDTNPISNHQVNDTNPLLEQETNNTIGAKKSTFYHMMIKKEMMMTNKMMHGKDTTSLMNHQAKNDTVSARNLKNSSMPIILNRQTNDTYPLLDQQTYDTNHILNHHANDTSPALDHLINDTIAARKSTFYHMMVNKMMHGKDTTSLLNHHVNDDTVSARNLKNSTIPILRKEDTTSQLKQYINDTNRISNYITNDTIAAKRNSHDEYRAMVIERDYRLPSNQHLNDIFSSKKSSYYHMLMNARKHGKETNTLSNQQANDTVTAIKREKSNDTMLREALTFLSNQNTNDTFSSLNHIVEDTKGQDKGPSIKHLTNDSVTAKKSSYYHMLMNLRNRKNMNTNHQENVTVTEKRRTKSNDLMLREVLTTLLSNKNKNITLSSINHTVNDNEIAKRRNYENYDIEMKGLDSSHSIKHHVNDPISTKKSSYYHMLMNARKNGKYTNTLSNHQANDTVTAKKRTNSNDTMLREALDTLLSNQNTNNTLYFLNHILNDTKTQDKNSSMKYHANDSVTAKKSYYYHMLMNLRKHGKDIHPSSNQQANDTVTAKKRTKSNDTILLEAFTTLLTNGAASTENQLANVDTVANRRNYEDYHIVTKERDSHPSIKHHENDSVTAKKSSYYHMLMNLRKHSPSSVNHLANNTLAVKKSNYDLYRKLRGRERNPLAINKTSSLTHYSNDPVAAEKRNYDQSVKLGKDSSTSLNRLSNYALSDKKSSYRHMVKHVQKYTPLLKHHVNDSVTAKKRTYFHMMLNGKERILKFHKSYQHKLHYRTRLINETRLAKQIIAKINQNIKYLIQAEKKQLMENLLEKSGTTTGYRRHLLNKNLTKDALRVMNNDIEELMCQYKKIVPLFHPTQQESSCQNVSYVRGMEPTQIPWNIDNIKFLINRLHGNLRFIIGNHRLFKGLSYKNTEGRFILNNTTRTFPLKRMHYNGKDSKLRDVFPTMPVTKVKEQHKTNWKSDHKGNSDVSNLGKPNIRQSKGNKVNTTRKIKVKFGPTSSKGDPSFSSLNTKVSDNLDDGTSYDMTISAAHDGTVSKENAYIGKTSDGKISSPINASVASKIKNIYFENVQLVRDLNRLSKMAKEISENNHDNGFDESAASESQNDTNVPEIQVSEFGELIKDVNKLKQSYSHKYDENEVKSIATLASLSKDLNREYTKRTNKDSLRKNRVIIGSHSRSGLNRYIKKPIKEQSANKRVLIADKYADNAKGSSGSTDRTSNYNSDNMNSNEDNNDPETVIEKKVEIYNYKHKNVNLDHVTGEMDSLLRQIDQSETKDLINENSRPSKNIHRYENSPVSGDSGKKNDIGRSHKEFNDDLSQVINDFKHLADDIITHSDVRSDVKGIQHLTNMFNEIEGENKKYNVSNGVNEIQNNHTQKKDELYEAKRTNASQVHVLDQSLHNEVESMKKQNVTKLNNKTSDDKIKNKTENSHRNEFEKNRDIFTLDMKINDKLNNASKSGEQNAKNNEVIRLEKKGFTLDSETRKLSNSTEKNELHEKIHNTSTTNLETNNRTEKINKIHKIVDYLKRHLTNQTAVYNFFKNKLISLNKTNSLLDYFNPSRKPYNSTIKELDRRENVNLVFSDEKYSEINDMVHDFLSLSKRDQPKEPTSTPFDKADDVYDRIFVKLNDLQNKIDSMVLNIEKETDKKEEKIRQRQDKLIQGIGKPMHSIKSNLYRYVDKKSINHHLKNKTDPFANTSFTESNGEEKQDTKSHLYIYINKNSHNKHMRNKTGTNNSSTDRKSQLYIFTDKKNENSKSIGDERIDYMFLNHDKIRTLLDRDGVVYSKLGEPRAKFMQDNGDITEDLNEYAAERKNENSALGRFIQMSNRFIHKDGVEYSPTGAMIHHKHASKSNVTNDTSQYEDLKMDADINSEDESVPTFTKFANAVGEDIKKDIKMDVEYYTDRIDSKTNGKHRKIEDSFGRPLNYIKVKAKNKTLMNTNFDNTFEDEDNNVFVVLKKNKTQPKMAGQMLAPYSLFRNGFTKVSRKKRPYRLFNSSNSIGETFKLENSTNEAEEEYKNLHSDNEIAGDEIQHSNHDLRNITTSDEEIKLHNSTDSGSSEKVNVEANSKLKNNTNNVEDEIEKVKTKAFKFIKNITENGQTSFVGTLNNDTDSTGGENVNVIVNSTLKNSTSNVGDENKKANAVNVTENGHASFVDNAYDSMLSTAHDDYLHLINPSKQNNLTHDSKIQNYFKSDIDVYHDPITIGEIKMENEKRKKNIKNNKAQHYMITLVNDTSANKKFDDIDIEDEEEKINHHEREELNKTIGDLEEEEKVRKMASDEKEETIATNATVSHIEKEEPIEIVVNNEKGESKNKTANDEEDNLKKMADNEKEEAIKKITHNELEKHVEKEIHKRNESVSIKSNSTSHSVSFDRPQEIDTNNKTVANTITDFVKILKYGIDKLGEMTHHKNVEAFHKEEDNIKPMKNSSEESGTIFYHDEGKKKIKDDSPEIDIVRLPTNSTGLKNNEPLMILKYNSTLVTSAERRNQTQQQEVMSEDHFVKSNNNTESVDNEGFVEDAKGEKKDEKNSTSSSRKKKRKMSEKQLNQLTDVIETIIRERLKDNEDIVASYFNVSKNNISVSEDETVHAASKDKTLSYTEKKELPYSNTHGKVGSPIVPNIDKTKNNTVKTQNTTGNYIDEDWRIKEMMEIKRNKTTPLQGDTTPLQGDAYLDSGINIMIANTSDELPHNVSGDYRYLVLPPKSYMIIPAPIGADNANGSTKAYTIRTSDKFAVDISTSKIENILSDSLEDSSKKSTADIVVKNDASLSNNHPQITNSTDSNLQISTSPDSHPQITNSADIHPQITTLAESHPQITTPPDIHPQIPTLAESHPQITTPPDSHPQIATPSSTNSSTLNSYFNEIETKTQDEINSPSYKDVRITARKKKINETLRFIDIMENEINNLLVDDKRQEAFLELTNQHNKNKIEKFVKSNKKEEKVPDDDIMDYAKNDPYSTEFPKLKSTQSTDVSSSAKKPESIQAYRKRKKEKVKSYRHKKHHNKDTDSFLESFDKRILNQPDMFAYLPKDLTNPTAIGDYNLDQSPIEDTPTKTRPTKTIKHAYRNKNPWGGYLGSEAELNKESVVKDGVNPDASVDFLKEDLDTPEFDSKEFLRNDVNAYSSLTGMNPTAPKRLLNDYPRVKFDTMMAPIQDDSPVNAPTSRNSPTEEFDPDQTPIKEDEKFKGIENYEGVEATPNLKVNGQQANSALLDELTPIPSKKSTESQFDFSIGALPSYMNMSRAINRDDEISNSRQASFVNEFQRNEMKDELSDLRKETTNGLKSIFNTAVEKQNNFMTNVESGVPTGYNERIRNTPVPSFSDQSVTSQSDDTPVGLPMVGSPSDTMDVGPLINGLNQQDEKKYNMMSYRRRMEPPNPFDI